MTHSDPRLILGCMTGTSLDGLDAAAVRVRGRGLSLRAELVDHADAAMPDDLRRDLLWLAQGGAAPPITYLQTARALGRWHAEAIAPLIEKHPIDFVVAHGQTIWHAGEEHLSWQLFDPWPIVRTHGLPVCYDLRQADLIAGGQGAPITPLADAVFYGGQGVDAVVNLGGVCNITRLAEAPADITAGDVCPCNLLIDAVVQRARPGLRYDEDGQLALAGTADPEPFAHLFEHERRSLGREDLSDARISLAIQPFGPGADAVASAVEAVARQIGRALGDARRVVLAGGGARNPVLVERIAAHAVGDVVLSDDYGIPAQAREAMAFAVLGTLCQDGETITLPAVTGAKNPGVAGVWAYAEGRAVSD